MLRGLSAKAERYFSITYRAASTGAKLSTTTQLKTACKHSSAYDNQKVAEQKALYQIMIGINQLNLICW